LFSERGQYVAQEHGRITDDSHKTQQSQAQWEAVLRGAQDVIIVVDEENHILLCNAAACAALDVVEADLLYQPVGESIPYPTLLSMFDQVYQTGQATRSKVSLEDNRTFNAQLTPIAGVGRVLVMQDITHLKELDRVKSELVTAVSHDLRTPLTTAQGYLDLLSRAGPLNKRQQDYILHARQSLETITELIVNLLDVDRLEAGLDLEMIPCDLVQVINRAVEDFQLLAEEHEQDLRWEPPKELPLVQGNPYRLRQVMNNLLSNVIKYTREGGWIAVNAAEEEEHVVVHVADNGIGIPPDQLPYIFDRFYRVKSDETANIPGTGLGLMIVKTVIEKHNGRVWVESKPGAGSVFSFILPTLKTGSSSG